MRTAFKRIVSLMLTAIMVFGTVGAEISGIDFNDVFSFRAEATCSGTCGDNLTWSIDTSNYTLTISGTGEMYNYSYNSLAPWHEYELYVKTINISYGVTSIGDYAFYNLFWLVDLNIPESVTSIGRYALSDLFSLQTVTIPASVTTIKEKAFYDCLKLECVTFGANSKLKTIGTYAFASNAQLISVDFGTNSALETIGERAFGSCQKLKNITIPDNVTSIGKYAFYFCSELESVTFGTNSKLALIDYRAFSNCGKLTSIIIPDSVKSMGNYAFYTCQGLKSVIIGNGLTTISTDAFRGCSALTDLKISNSVTTIECGAFESCYKLTSLTIPDSVKIIGGSAFANCSDLANITLGSGITTIGKSAFTGCKNITDVYYTGNMTGWCNIDFVNETAQPINYGANLYIDDQLINGKLTVTDGVTQIKLYAFYNYDYITSISFSDSVTDIGDYAFYDCDGLTELTVPGNIKKIGFQSFAKCDKLTSVNILDGVKFIGKEAFYRCLKLADISIADSVVNIGFEAFFDTEYYSNDANWVNDGDYLYIDNHLISASEFHGLRDGLISIADYAMVLSECGGVGLPDSLKGVGEGAFLHTQITRVLIGKNLEYIGFAAFCDVNVSDVFVDEENLYFTSDSDVLFSKDKTELVFYPPALYAYKNSYVIPDSVKTIAPGAFRCSTLSNITIPSSVKTIGYSAFEFCEKIQEITIPGSVESIGSKAFSGCTSLTGIVIPNSVKYIGENAFSGCANMEYMHWCRNVDGRDFDEFLPGEETPAHICAVTEHCYAKVYAGDYGKEFRICDGHGVEQGLTKIQIKSLPDKTVYVEGDTLDTTGLTLLATFPDGTTETISCGYICSPTLLNTVGIQTITVTCGGKTCTFNVTVKSPEIETIEIISLPTLTEYFVGDTLNTSGLTLTATYNNGKTETVTSGFTCSPTTLSKAGAQTVTVTYGGKTCTFSVTVKADELVNVAVKTAPTKTEYFVGDTLNTSGLTLTATYNNGKTETVTSGFTCSPTTLTKAGAQIVTVTYGGKTCTFSVTVKADELVKVAVKTAPTKTEYFVGDTLNTSGLTLTATYNSGKTETVTSGFTCAPTTFTKVGTQTVTVTYGGKTCTFSVTVKADELVNVAVKTAPTKTEYFVGDTLNTSGLTLTATYNSGKTETVTSGFTCSPTTLTKAGAQIVTATYSGKTCTFSVTVKADELVKIAVKTAPTKTEYFVGDTLNTSGLTLTAIYNNGKTETVTSGFVCSPTTLSFAGNQVITVSYGGKTCTFSVTVETVELVKITVKTAPTKTEYFVGDTLNTSGLTLTATYNNGKTETVTSGFTCAPTTFTKVGTQTVTVTYSGKTCTFNVNVVSDELVKITVKTAPTKTEYFVGDTLNTSGLTLTATYNNGKTETVTSGFVCSPTTLSFAGNQVITVSYGGKTCTLSVKVNKSDVSDNYSVTYMANGKRYAQYLVIPGDPVPTPAVNPVVDGMIFEGWSPEIVQIMPEKDLVYTAVFHKHSYEGRVAIHPTCTQHGTKLYTCSCNDSYTEIIPALGHSWGDWIIVDEPTSDSNGKKVRYCSRCGEPEFESIAALNSSFRVEPIPDQEYTGFGRYPAIKVYSLSGGRLTEFVDYEVAYENNINVGTATAIVKGIGEHFGLFRVNFNIIKRDIATLDFAEIPDITYTGSEITPDPIISFGKFVLVKDVDYTVKYESNVDEGKAEIIITGIGNFSGTKTISFNILANDSGFTVPEINDQKYTGEAVAPKFNIFFGDKVLIQDVNYTVEYIDNIDVGYSQIIVKGIGEYSGSISIVFKINATQLPNISVPVLSAETYDGEEYKPDFDKYPLTYGGKKLVEGVDFKTEVYNNRNAGTVKIVIIGIGNFTGTIEIYVSIVAADISGASVSKINDVEYKGSALTPSFTVSQNGKKLIKDVDYTVEYRNNTAVGTATVVIKGIGNYKGEKSFTFRIVEPIYYELAVFSDSETLGYDSVMQIRAEINPSLDSDYTFVYESSNAKIASVDGNGMVKALDEGEVVITVTVVDEEGNPVLNPDGEEITAEITIKCTMTCWQKIVRFFRKLFSIFTRNVFMSAGIQIN